VRSSEVHPQIAIYGSQRMCWSCGAITRRGLRFRHQHNLDPGPQGDERVGVQKNAVTAHVFSDSGDF
jgi:hypothetical protein